MLFQYSHVPLASCNPPKEHEILVLMLSELLALSKTEGALEERVVRVNGKHDADQLLVLLCGS